MKKRDLSKLELLSRLIQDVDSAPDMETGLQVMVERTREIMGADVCTVYLTEHERQRHVVVATDGLSPTVVGQVQIGVGQGLIGKVAKSTKPINLNHVPAQLDEAFVQQSGAGCFHGFLGVPVTHRSEVQGVIVVRSRAERRFDEVDAAFLTTLAAQLGGALAYAKASGALWGPTLPEGAEPGWLDGLPGAPGITIGTGVVIFSPTDLNSVPNHPSDDPGAEERYLRDAITQVRGEIQRFVDNLDNTLLSADRALFDAYAMILDSSELMEATVARIRSGNWAPGALHETIEEYARRFDEMEDPYLRERGADIRGLGNRILLHLRDVSDDPGEYPPNTILISRQLSAIELGLVPLDRLRGIISEEGSSMSHAAILARACNIPAVMGVRGIPLEHLDNQEVIADGTRGRIHIRPTPELRSEIKHLIREERILEKELGTIRDLPSETKNGKKVPLYTNVGLIAELPLAKAVGAAGIGLFRSELPFMLYDRFPTEQEQVEVYRQVLEAVAPHPVNLRTLDVGGDKPLPYWPIAELNPMLGWRGIRLTLDHPEIFLTQLRAALRANVGLGNLRLLLPMVNGVTDVEEARSLIDQAHGQLLEEGVESARPPVGLMIEVPSAIYQLEELVRRVDFFSVGSNDLAQFLLAIDRGNPNVVQRLDPLHPAILRALRQVVDACTRAGKPVALCGEMASDPGCALLLLGLGFNSLSINAAALPRVKWAIRSVDLASMNLLAEQALVLDRPVLVRKLVEKALADAGLNRLLQEPVQKATDKIAVKPKAARSARLETELR